jgi:hypothetical protein
MRDISRYSNLARLVKSFERTAHLAVLEQISVLPSKIAFLIFA